MWHVPLIRPPHGIMPERYWLQERMSKLVDAMRRIEQHPEPEKYLDQVVRLVDEYNRHEAALAALPPL